MRKGPSAAAILLLLSACSAEPETPVARFSFDEARQVAGVVATSPDTTDAVWTVSEDGQAVRFGKAGAAPLVTLACRMDRQPAQLAVIRHVPSRPGQTALFPVIGNGTVSRFKVDAVLADGEWRWEGALPAADPLNDVFTGVGELEATLPGGGSVISGPSRIPSEFVTWCRQGSRLQRAQAPAQASAQASAPADVPSPSPTPRP